jgi:hypothetical protein
MINVKDAQFGATGDGSTDDRAAIQRAVDYAKNLTLANNSAVRYRVTIFFPAGYYFIGGPINLTNTNGLWLKGDGGSYLNTIILGNTGGVMFDFSGSSLSGCEGFTFITSDRGNRSTTGVLFALTSNGGLNCGIRQCYFEMTDQPSANGGFGSIGILNVRSEEFYIHECVVRANTSLIMSYVTNLSASGTNYTVTSPFQTLPTDAGSMGVTSINGTSLQTYEKRQPAMVLLGVNNLNFQGYIARLSANTGTNETAILCVQYTTNLKIHANIESFSRALRVLNAGFEGNDFDLTSSNVTSPTTELVDLTNSTVKGLKLRITLPVLSERSNRYVVYHAPDSNANNPAAGSMINSEITCYDITSNQFIISPNLLTKSANMVFNTYKPFEKKGGKLRQLSNNRLGAGSNGSVSAVNALQFTQADNPASSNGRGGYYRVWIDGVIQAGSYGSGGSAVLTFQAQLIVNQNNVGTIDAPSATVIILDKSVTNPAYLDVIGVLVNISFSNRIGTVTVTPRVTGSGTGELVFYNGVAELQTDFLVNDSLLL